MMGDDEISDAKLKQDLHFYYMFQDDPERAFRETGMTKEQH